MTIINEKKFDISLNDINSILENFKNSIFRIFPNWDSINTELLKKSNLKSEVLIARIESFFFNSFDCQQADTEMQRGKD